MSALHYMSIACDSAQVAPGDVESEARIAFAEIESRLDRAGLALTDIVKLRFFYTGVQDFPMMNAIRDPLFRDRFTNEAFPASTGVITGGRGGGTPRLELEVIAGRGKRALLADGVTSRFGGVRPPFSHANEVDGLLFMSGQGAYGPDGELAATGSLEQAHLAAEALDHILAAAGRTVDDLLTTTVYLTPTALEDQAAVIQSVTERLGQARPVVATLPVNELAFDGMHVEIEAVAGPPGGKAIKRSLPQPRTGPFSLAAAVSAPGFLYSAATAFSAEPAKISAALERALTSMDGLTNVETPALTTIWYSDHVGRELVRKAGADVGLRGALTLAPAPWSNPQVVVEMFG